MRVKFPRDWLKLHQLLEKLRKRSPRFLPTIEIELAEGVTVNSEGHLVKVKETDMSRGNMPDELFKEEVDRHHRVMDEFAESTHRVISNLVAKVKDLERDMDTTISCEAALKERVEKLERLTDPESGQ